MPPAVVPPAVVPPLANLERAEALLRGLNEPGPPGRDPAVADVRQQLLAIAAELSPADDRLSREDLDDFRRLWAWVRRQPSSWELWDPAEPPSGDMQSCVLDGRPDLESSVGDDDVVHPPANRCLEGEALDAWVTIAHGHDGHRFMMWDTSCTTEVHVLTVDNTEQEVIVGFYEDAQELMRSHVFPDMIASIRFRAEAAARRAEIDAPYGCVIGLAWVVGPLLAIAALVWWLMG